MYTFFPQLGHGNFMYRSSWTTELGDNGGAGGGGGSSIGRMVERVSCRVSRVLLKKPLSGLGTFNLKTF